MKKLFLIISFILLAASPVLPNEERWYQEKWCKGVGEVEYRLKDGTRVDCLTSSHAIEFDFGRKWAEAIGQSLYYSAQTGKRAGIVLIVRKEEKRFVDRLRITIERFSLPIDVWLLETSVK